MTKLTRDELKTMLLENECIVEFTKINGDKRSMPCTLNADLMPDAPEVDSTKKTKTPNPLTLNAWCTDKKEWRSFRVANVIDIQIVNPITE